MLLRFLLGLEVDKFSIRKERIAITNHGALYRLLNQVIRKKNVITTHSIVENEKGILPISRGHPSLKHHIGEVCFEDFHLPR